MGATGNGNGLAPGSRSHHRVDLHLLKLFASKLSRFVEDVFRDGDLTDVVQREAALSAISISPTPNSLPISMAYTWTLKMIMRGLVLSFNR
jgi:hypothetical protein